jgi:hypothetical protein
MAYALNPPKGILQPRYTTQSGLLPVVYRVTVLQPAPPRDLVSGFGAEVPPAEPTVVPMPCHFESMSSGSVAVALAGNRNFLVATISEAWYLALKLERKSNITQHLT